ncbi:hypothetical protein [Peribacillus muralis]|uniref:hypothetical protein n=1 Tax=Peribacillus muralis TaxID=264697 RepID=UPI00070BE6E1|nr:hypothetical protein [Peribacillus muralis]
MNGREATTVSAQENAVRAGSKMQYYIIFGLVIFNVLVCTFKIESIIPFIMVAGLVGLYKGTKTGSDFKKIFNLHKVDFSLKESRTRTELLGAFMLSVSTDILSIKYYFHDENFIYVAIHVLCSLLFGLLLFRLLFLNMFKKDESMLKWKG